MTEGSRKPRISIEVDADLSRRLEIAAAHRNISIQQYVLTAVVHALEGEDTRIWSHLSEPAFARDWDSDTETLYDCL